MNDDIQSARRLALLIDCDNADASMARYVLQEANTEGRVTVSRCYGDWSQRGMKGWHDATEQLAMQPVQQFNQRQKNSTDIALIVDAMDILYSRTVDGFCIYSGDSDYKPLVMRMREHGMYMIGFGEKERTSGTLVHAFDRFVYTENLSPRQSRAVPESQELGKLENRVGDIYDRLADGDGMILLSRLGFELRKDPAFDPRGYGATNLSNLVERLGGFTLERNKDKMLYLVRKSVKTRR